jgi:hypothetical protein
MALSKSLNNDCRSGGESVLAEQLLTFAQDFISEYRNHDIMRMLGQTASILQRRATLNDGAYEQEAVSIRQKCNATIMATRFNTYPTEWQRVTSRSGFARFLPAKVAQEMLSALPTNRSIAPQSSEMNLYETQCANMLIMAQNFLPFAQQFDLSTIAIPKNELGVLVEIPRRAFEDKAGNFSDTLKNFPIWSPLSPRS